MTITLDLAPEAEARLQQVAAKHGQDANEFVTGLLEPQITYLLFWGLMPRRLRRWEFPCSRFMCYRRA